jgi:hypothetical protein
MSRSDENNADASLTSELHIKSVEEKKTEIRDRFDQNYYEFKNKKLSEVPCFKSTFLTS